jgi:hypothetical protein
LGCNIVAFPKKFCSERDTKTLAPTGSKESLSPTKRAIIKEVPEKSQINFLAVEWHLLLIVQRLSLLPEKGMV